MNRRIENLDLNWPELIWTVWMPRLMRSLMLLMLSSAQVAPDNSWLCLTCKHSPQPGANSSLRITNKFPRNPVELFSLFHWMACFWSFFAATLDVCKFGSTKQLCFPCTQREGPLSSFVIPCQILIQRYSKHFRYFRVHQGPDLLVNQQLCINPKDHLCWSDGHGLAGTSSVVIECHRNTTCCKILKSTCPSLHLRQLFRRAAFQPVNKLKSEWGQKNSEWAWNLTNSISILGCECLCE